MEAIQAVYRFRVIFLAGLKVTIMLSLTMMIGGVILGCLTAIGLSAKGKSKAVLLLKKVITVYVELFRGAPLLILLFFGYYGLAYLGINVDSYTACGLILVLYAGAYICEIIRSGIESIPKGQYEAAYCVGLNYIDVLRFIILPQAFRIFLPTLVGFFISAIKDTTIVSLIGCADLMKQGVVIINKTGLALEIYILIAIVYFVICYPLSLYVRKLESRRAS